MVRRIFGISLLYNDMLQTNYILQNNMINAQSVAALKSAKWTELFNRPLYEGYAFSQIPSTVEQLLTGSMQNGLPKEAVGGRYEKYDLVILFVIDGFGWEFFEGYASKYPFLNRFEKEGIASKISAQFPSTTAAHITTIHTGKEVGETGIYEWFYYEPLVDRMIAPLLFSYAGDHETSTLVYDGFNPATIFPFETIYQRLSKKGIKSVVLQQSSIAHSAYSKQMFIDAEIVPFANFSEAQNTLVRLCQTPCEQPTYAFVYFGDIDAVGHRHGITSPQFSDTVEACWTKMESQLWQKLGKCPNKIALMLTADHGMTPVDPKTTILLNQLCPKLPSLLTTNRQGQPLVPAGSCRDFFLHIQDAHLQEAETMLQDALKDKADVIRVETLLSQGFFGKKPPSKRLKERIGNLVVLPHVTESVFWWFEKHRLEQHFYAAHGGLTPEEMESPFLFIPFGK